MGGLQDPAPAPQAGSSKVNKKAVAAAGVDLLLDDDSSEGEKENNFEPEVNPEDFIQMVTEESSGKVMKMKQPGFFERAAFLELNELGLAVIPNMAGVHIWHHVSSSQWHAQYGKRSYSPTWGNQRTEKKALALAIVQLWQWFVDDHPDDTEAKAQLEFINTHISSID